MFDPNEPTVPLSSSQNYERVEWESVHIPHQPVPVPVTFSQPYAQKRSNGPLAIGIAVVTGFLLLVFSCSAAVLYAAHNNQGNSVSTSSNGLSQQQELLQLWNTFDSEQPAIQALNNFSTEFENPSQFTSSILKNDASNLDKLSKSAVSDMQKVQVPNDMQQYNIDTAQKDAAQGFSLISEGSEQFLNFEADTNTNAQDYAVAQSDFQQGARLIQRATDIYNQAANSLNVTLQSAQNV